MKTIKLSTLLYVSEKLYSEREDVATQATEKVRLELMRGLFSELREAPIWGSIRVEAIVWTRDYLARKVDSYHVDDARRVMWEGRHEEATRTGILTVKGFLSYTPLSAKP